jgi:hypothetical protein
MWVNVKIIKNKTADLLLNTLKGSFLVWPAINFNALLTSQDTKLVSLLGLCQADSLGLWGLRPNFPWNPTWCLINWASRKIYCICAYACAKCLTHLWIFPSCSSFLYCGTVHIPSVGAVLCIVGCLEHSWLPPSRNQWCIFFHGNWLFTILEAGRSKREALANSMSGKGLVPSLYSHSHKSDYKVPLVNRS